MGNNKVEKRENRRDSMMKERRDSMMKERRDSMMKEREKQHDGGKGETTWASVPLQEAWLLMQLPDTGFI
ncbi:hypothetical protein Pmani_004486 [Petrolisthes manimaculis]|uniref:Uncharacterized protein n=1 Tax=Petrolisthes manimaculis TaxID=1843537 RepID=A0AAE1QDL1_9EUCA|nr:hypothetical protein Pmani_004486 [Petrolisthes manimaculis]